MFFYFPGHVGVHGVPGTIKATTTTTPHHQHYHTTRHYQNGHPVPQALEVASAAESASGRVGDGYRASPLHPQTADPASVDWVFLVTALNFNFWTPEGSVKYRVQHDGVMYDGYFSVCAAVNRALEASAFQSLAAKLQALL